jgi:hypothetical protein
VENLVLNVLTTIKIKRKGEDEERERTRKGRGGEKKRLN